jgi:DNA-binding MltR family transcriptional regulator
VTGWFIEGQEDWVTIGDLEDPNLPDRVLGILAPAFLDHRLTERLIKGFQSDSRVSGDMRKGVGPFGNLNTKINLGFLLGIYSVQVRNDFFKIQDIRNRFAHSHTRLDFNSPEILQHVHELTTIGRLAHDGWLHGGPDPIHAFLAPQAKRVPTDNRSIFITTVQILITLIGLRPMASPPTPEF